MILTFDSQRARLNFLESFTECNEINNYIVDFDEFYDVIEGLTKYVLRLEVKTK